MNYRPLGRTGLQVSEVSLGTWQVGGGWGKVFDEKAADRILHEAADQGINFFDTADVYDDQQSERAVGKMIRSRPEDLYLATKIGRRLNPHTPEAYTPAALTEFVEQALRNTGLDTLDLVQLHCPPTLVYEDQRVFDCLDQLKAEGKLRHYGVSVEKVSEAIRAMDHPGVETVQIIFNMFRLKPAEELFPLLKARPIGILARVPLASGLLTGKFSKASVFDAGDHRQFNRKGEAFDKGETFSGIDYEQGLLAVSEIQDLLGDGSLAAYALRWVLMFEVVSCVIPGASQIEQVGQNIKAAALSPFSQAEMEGVKEIYDRYFRAEIHPQW